MIFLNVKKINVSHGDHLFYSDNLVSFSELQLVLDNFAPLKSHTASITHSPPGLLLIFGSKDLKGIWNTFINELVLCYTENCMTSMLFFIKMLFQLKNECYAHLIEETVTIKLCSQL